MYIAGILAQVGEKAGILAAAVRTYIPETLWIAIAMFWIAIDRSREVNPYPKTC